MRVVDLYCGEGGAGAGYRNAGATLVVGVDLKATRRYPGALFIRGDVLELDVEFLRQFDLVHASPPCQFGTALRFAPGAKGAAGHVNLIPQTRALLKRAGVPYVIENVAAVAAAGHLIDPIMLNGFMFDLGATTSTGQRFHLDRERWFETNWGLAAPTRAWKRRTPVIGMYGGHVRNRSAAHGGRGTVDFPGEDRPALAREAMGMSWATMNGMSEAIPPAMTTFIGLAFREALAAQRRAA
ncbi:MAG TPA: hypothetical protein VFW13_12920 [Phenylobacterium sp.]|nr:hypothetical protein [Phenylobacterium sp.]